MLTVIPLFGVSKLIQVRSGSGFSNISSSFHSYPSPRSPIHMVMHSLFLFQSLVIVILFTTKSFSTGFIATTSVLKRGVPVDLHTKPLDANDDDDGIELNGVNHNNNSNDIMKILSKRIIEVSESQRFQERLDRFHDKVDGETSLILDLPVICFDAILPNQVMEGSTSDSTFVSFLRELGLGGWFVMTSLDFKKRMVRRNGTLCKIEFLDMVKTNDRLPTSIDFVIRGEKRIRIIGENHGMKRRIGRWRRSYDDYGEESILGWGPERFLDAPVSTTSVPFAPVINYSELSLMTLNDPSKFEWSLTRVECYHDDTSEVTDDLIRRAKLLLPLVETWYDLASDMKTYENIQVTATARVQQGQPFMSVQPDNLLQRVKKDLGEMPELNRQGIHDFVFWVAALINPLPCLGVSLEIRGKVLEACGLEEKFNILEFGLQRSIQNLRGERPL